MDFLADIYGSAKPAVTSTDKTASVERAVWKLWCESTNRKGSARKMPKHFADAVRKALKGHYLKEDMAEWVYHAATQPPRPRDPHDIRRFTMMATNEKYRRAVMSTDLTTTDVVEWVEPVVNQSALLDVQQACGLERSMWKDSDYEACDVLTTKFTPDELVQLATKAQLELGATAVTPEDLLRVSKTRGAKHKPSGRDTYDAGVAEAQTLDGVRLHLDNMAQRMYLNGADVEAVRALHFAAPDGYWDAVEDYADVEEAYADLEEQFGFKPTDRSMG